MATLKFEKYEMPAANMGKLNCLPDILDVDYIHSPITVSENVSDEDKKYIGQGMINTILPYMEQDGYDRSRDIKGFDAAVLENEYLKAIFLPELGGRLWSLFDKKANRELLYKNDVFQPGNLALRNAWFSGGVEWNLGIKGHNPLTCCPMFAQEVKDENGEVMLRMYEYERIREVAYSLTAKLSGDTLLVHIEIENTEDKDKFMYWWSNIAVPENEKTRVVVPTDNAFYCAYQDGGYLLDVTPLPIFDGFDATYPSLHGRSRDFFYNLEKSKDKWVCAVEEDGYGLAHISDENLIGRKTFLWGQGQGGRHWNNWLSDCGKNYIEIQAGLRKTQLEHFVMSANSKISWTEGYCAVNSNPEAVHDADLAVAIEEIKKCIIDNQSTLDNTSFSVKSENAPEYYGSGWGALENKIRGKKISGLVNFPEDSIKNEESDWVYLLENGNLPAHNAYDEPVSYVKGDFWIDLLNKAEDSWNKFYMLGVSLYEKGSNDRAYAAFEKSIALCENAWAYRNLAQMERKLKKNFKKSAELILKSISLKSDYRPLLIDCGEMLIDAEEYAKWIEIFEVFDENFKNDGRLKMLYAICLTRTGRSGEAAAILNDSFVMYDIREGEYSLSHVWTDIYRNIHEAKTGKVLTDSEVMEEYPLPASLDYRMH